MKKLTLIALLLAPSFAFAQNALAPVPYIVSPQEHQAILNYLAEQPYRFAAPLINQLAQMEQKAQAEAKAKIEKDKSDAKQKP